ncbi:MAG: hypothetical protein LBS56_02705, partial [Propionibacteriaceae bacterium]|nr:hypothetical protein [Propionibacteriaceae bacterium]
IPGWMRTVQQRYRFLRDLDVDEQRWMECNPRDDHEVTQALEAIADWTPPEPEGDHPESAGGQPRVDSIRRA